MAYSTTHDLQSVARPWLCHVRIFGVSRAQGFSQGFSVTCACLERRVLVPSSTQGVTIRHTWSVQRLGTATYSRVHVV